VDDAAMADMVDETETVDKVSTWGGIPAKNSKGENLLLFIGHFHSSSLLYHIFGRKIGFLVSP
jgi:hypothetical protein